MSRLQAILDQTSSYALDQHLYTVVCVDGYRLYLGMAFYYSAQRRDHLKAKVAEHGGEINRAQYEVFDVFRSDGMEPDLAYRCALALES